MVQEPTTQFLRLEMFDWDRINAKELLTLNLVKVSMCNTQACPQSLNIACEDHPCSGSSPCFHLMALELQRTHLSPQGLTSSILLGLCQAVAAKQALQAPGQQKTTKGGHLSNISPQMWLFAHCAYVL